MSLFQDFSSPSRSSSPPATYSPASSPSIGPCDSSAPSSPSPEYQSLSPPASPGLVHPYAASTKGVRAPRIYERHERRISEHDDEISFRLDLIDPHALPSSRSHTTRTLSHPLAGSANSIWQPPEWEKKPSHSHNRTTSSASTGSTGTFDTDAIFTAPSRRFAESDYDYDAIDLSDDEQDTQSAVVRRQRLEQNAWENAINQAFDHADGIIDLGYVLSRFSIASFLLQ